MNEVLKQQQGGDHYKTMGIQPAEYCAANNLGFMEGNIVKYVSRHKAKAGILDVKKALHFCQLILKLVYGIESTVTYYDPPTDPSQLPEAQKTGH